MGKKTNQVCEALIEGATSGLRDEALYGFVLRHNPKVGHKTLMRATIKALEDPELIERNVLQAIATLAITHKIQALSSPPA